MSPCTRSHQFLPTLRWGSIPHYSRASAGKGAYPGLLSEQHLDLDLLTARAGPSSIHHAHVTDVCNTRECCPACGLLAPLSLVVLLPHGQLQLASIMGSSLLWHRLSCIKPVRKMLGMSISHLRQVTCCSVLIPYQSLVSAWDAFWKDKDLIMFSVPFINRALQGLKCSREVKMITNIQFS